MNKPLTIAESKTSAHAFNDDRGRALRVGDNVRATAIDYGTPAWATFGTVVGFGRTRVYVRWNGNSYDERHPHHSTYGAVLRIVEG